jgi:hypothetical protein
MLGRLAVWDPLLPVHPARLYGLQGLFVLSEWHMLQVQVI